MADLMVSMEALRPHPLEQRPGVHLQVPGPVGVSETGWSCTSAAQAGGSSSGTYSVGQRLPGHTEYRLGGVGAVLLECVEGASCGLSDGHRHRNRLILALANGDAWCAVWLELDVVPRQGLQLPTV